MENFIFCAMFIDYVKNTLTRLNFSSLIKFFPVFPFDTPENGRKGIKREL